MKKTKFWLGLSVVLTPLLFSAPVWSKDMAAPFEVASALETKPSDIGPLVEAEALTSNAFAFSFLPMPQWVNPNFSEAEASKAISKPQSLQVLPIPFAGYQDTYGLLGGAALALYDPNTQTRLTTSFLTNFNGYLRYKARFDWRRPGEWLFSTNASVGNDFQHFYGEGDNTPAVFQSFQDDLNLFGTSFQYAMNRNTYIGPSIAYVGRNWDNGAPPANYTNESEFRAGVQSTWDDRDDVLEPHEGTYYQVGLFTLPANGNTGFGADVWQLEGDARHFWTIFDNVVIAGRANFGWTLAGQPPYSFEYSLGGSSELRGFNTNRFRGLDFYGLQGEIRFPIFAWLNGSTSLDAGDITSTSFTNWPVASWQVGLRSDAAEKLGIVFRVDMGFSYSGSVFTFSINEPF